MSLAIPEPEVRFPETSPRFPGVELYRGAFDNWDFTIKKAYANLRRGIDTWCHWHSYHDDPQHRQCEMYVQDWLTELPFCAFKQIVMIFPGVDLEKHAVGRRRLYVAGDSTIESSIEYAQRVKTGCRPDFHSEFVDNAAMMHS